MMTKPKSLAERTVYCDVGKGSCRLKDSNGKTFTIDNYAYIFTWSKFFVTSTDEERITHTRIKFPIQSLVIIRMYGNCKDISVRLSRFLQPVLHAREKPVYKKFWEKYSNDVRTQLEISEEEVRKTIRKSLDSGSYRRESQRVVSVFWVVDTFLKRLPITKDSKWTTLPAPNVTDYMEKSSKTLMDEHVAFKEPYLSEVKEEITKEIEKKLEKSLYEKLKDRIKKV